MSSQENIRMINLRVVSNSVIIALLSGILVTLILILGRLPSPTPTLQAIRDAKTSQERVALVKRIPLVQVQGTVEVSGSVAVENTPLEVEISR